MTATYWHKQTADQPLYPDLLWSRPENKAQAGKLLVIGGNVHGFAAPAQAAQQATQTGVGLTRVLLPLSVKRLLPKGFLEVEFAPSTPSGSFSRQALAEALDAAAWADATLLAGDFGRNSETAVMLEQFLAKHSGPVIITQDAVDYFTKSPQALSQRPNTLLVLSFAQLQKLASSLGFRPAFRFSMDLIHLVEALHDFTHTYKSYVITKHHDLMLVATDGQVSTTKLTEDLPIWRVQTAARACVWWLQNPTKPFEALTTSILNVASHD